MHVQWKYMYTKQASKQSATNRNKQALKEIKEKQANTIDTNPN